MSSSQTPCATMWPTGIADRTTCPQHAALHHNSSQPRRQLLHCSDIACCFSLHHSSPAGGYLLQASTRVCSYLKTSLRKNLSTFYALHNNKVSSLLLTAQALTRALCKPLVPAHKP